MTITGSLKRGLVAGVCAGIVAAVFAFVVAEPTIDRAIELEGQRAAAAEPQQTADHSHAPGTSAHEHGEVVSRDVQRRAGAPAGFVAIGAALGLLFGLVYAGLRGSGDGWQRSLQLGAASIAVLLVVFARYPPNPPGVGDPATVDERTRYYFAALLLGFAGVGGAWRASRALAVRGWTPALRHTAVAIGGLAVVGAVYAVMPSTDDEIAIPAQLLWDFRVQSLATQLLLLGGIAAGFGVLSERAARARR